jgi:transcriptional antiterminator NusG
MKQWYVIQLIAGYEEKVKAEILRRVAEQGLTDVFGEILVPQAKVVNRGEFGEVTEEVENLFPGYMFISFDPTAEAFRLIRTVSRVFRFLGGENPVPLEPHEVDKILGQVRGEVSVAKKEAIFEVGREIDIASGPFSGFSGIISELDDSKQRLTIMVSIFGRLTPVEISYDQVKI